MCYLSSAVAASFTIFMLEDAVSYTPLCSALASPLTLAEELHHDLWPLSLVFNIAQSALILESMSSLISISALPSDNSTIFKSRIFIFALWAPIHEYENIKQEI